MNMSEYQPLYALADPNPTIKGIVVYNPLNVSDRVVADLDWAHKKPLSAYLDGLPDHLDWFITLNGREVDEGEWKVTFPKPDDYMTVMPIPHGGGGGGGGKSIVRMVAMVAVAVVAAWAAPVIAGSFMTAMGPAMAGQMLVSSTVMSITTAAIGGVITTVGGMLVNALLPPPKPPSMDTNYGGGGQDYEDSPSYGVDGAKTTSTEDVPVPNIYGEFRVGGNRTQTRTENEGDTQIVYLQNILSEGEIEDIPIDQILFDDQDASKFEDIEFQTRMGVANQELCDWFEETTVPITKQRELLYDDKTSSPTWAYHETTSEVDKFRVDVLFPRGLVKANSSNGNREDWTVNIKVKYRKIGTEAWTEMDTVSVTGKTRSPVRKSIDSPILEEGHYEVAVARMDPNNEDDDYITDTLQWVDLWEIITDKVAYNYTAYLACKIKLTGQLSRIPNITALVRGRKVNKYDFAGNVIAYEWTDNPAWITLDMLTNTRSGAGYSISRIDIPKFVEWAEYCEMKGLKFNGILDFKTNLWEALKLPLRVGHAQILPIGTRVSLALEKEDEPVMMFGAGNILEGTFQLEWQSLEDRANEFEVNYYDKEDLNRRKMVKVVDLEALDAGRPQKVASFNLPGVDNEAQAYSEAYFQMALNRYIQLSCTFEAPLDAIACTLGDLVYVQHDMPQWGYGGRTEAGSTKRVVKLDRPVELDTEQENRLLVHHSVIKRGEWTITAVGPTSVLIDAPGEVGGRVTRAIFPDGEDRNIDFVSGMVNQVEVGMETTEGLKNGDTLELYDTDVIEEGVIAFYDEAEMEVTLSNDLLAAPEHLMNWAVGPNITAKRLFRVINIDGDGEYKRQMKLLEYNASVYEDPQNASSPGNYSLLTTEVGQVENLNVSEELVRIGNVVKTELEVGWNTPARSLYDGAIIYTSEGGAAFTAKGEVSSGATSFIFDAPADGTELLIKVVAKDGIGTRANYSQAPIIVHTVVGKAAPPAMVKDFKAAKAVGGVRLSWSLNEEPDVVAYEIREGLNWENSVELATGLAGNTHLIEKVAGGTFTYLIRAIDSSGNVSEEVATVQLELPAPEQVVGFEAIKSLDQIVFTWFANQEPDIMGYEIREGVSWGGGLTLAKVSATQYSLPTSNPAPRTFWIKAYDSAGVYSDKAMLAGVAATEAFDRNVLVRQDEAAGSFPGTKIGVEHSGSKLILPQGLDYGEYIHEVDLGAERTARVYLADAFDAVQGASPTWADADFTWGSQEAGQPWEKSADMDTVSVERQIAVHTGTTDDVEAISLDKTLVGINGTTPTEQEGVSYTDGRFTSGLRVTDMTTVSWDVDVPQELDLSFWVRPEDVPNVASFVTIVNGEDYLRLRFRQASGRFELEGSDGVVLKTEPFTFEVDDALLVTIIQTGTQRKLYVGRSEDMQTVSGCVDATPIGNFTTIRLY
jgi:predicted phage tail protein